MRKTAGSETAAHAAVSLGRLLIVAEAAEYLRVSQKTIRRMIDDGRLRHFRIGRSIRIAESDLRALRRRWRK